VSAYLNKPSAALSKLPLFVEIILVLQVALYISVFFNIPVARQVVGFLYLTFIPGFVILRLFREDKLGLTETVLFSVGLSVAFMLLAGLVVNEVGLFVGVKQPLEPTILVLVLSAFVLLATLVNYFRGSHDLPPIGLTKDNVWKILVLCLLPVLSIVGAYVANVTGNTSVLLLALASVLAVFLVAAYSKRLNIEKLYLIIILLIAITLLFQFTLISNYVQGFDIKNENYIATLTQSSGYWNSSASFSSDVYGRFYSMLSITVLPTVYANILNMDPTWVFKIIYPLIFALVPLALYFLWRNKLGTTVAFISAFLFMSQLTFYTEIPALARQMIGEVFFVLLFLLLFSKNIRTQNVKILFVIFGFCLIVSHYSMAFIFAFFIALMWLIGYLAKKPFRHLSLSMVVLFIVLMFSYYAITSSSANITSIAQNLNPIFNGLNSFLDPGSRGSTVLEGLGLASAPTLLNSVSRTIQYVIEFFIVIGFIVLFLQRKKKDFDFEYFVPCSIAMLILAMCIVLPDFANSLNMTRFFHVSLFFIAPLFAIGCVELFRFATNLFGFAAKRKTQIYSFVFILLILGSYFLFQTSFVYQATGSESWSLPLSRYRLGSALYTEFEYATEPQAISAEWLAHNTDSSKLLVYADQTVSPNLVSYGGIYISHVFLLTNYTAPQLGQFVYLGELSTLYGKIYSNNAASNVSRALNSQALSLIYNNGYCEIYKQQFAP
jgi:uncharacterized membrane protein